MRLAAVSGHFACKEGNPLRILWMSNSPWVGTGYGVQTAQVVPRIKAAGHDIAVAVNHGHYGLTADMGDGIPLFPPVAGGDGALNDVIVGHAERWKADWVISLYDTWTMDRERWPERVASWVPIDHQPAPPAVVQWCKSVTPIAMSRFGQKMLRDQGIDSTYIPHSLDTSVFRPTEKTRGGLDPRKALDIPADAFVVLIAAANQGNHPPRKAWGQMFQALAVFMAAHPDAFVYLHTNQMGANRGLDLALLERAAGLPSERVRYTNPYAYVSGQVQPADLAAIYSMSDVLLASSMGEGFGVPVIEGQACGLPAIVSDFSAQPELCESGWLVKGQGWWDESPGQGQSWFFDPYVPSIVNRLNDAYAARGDQSIRERAVAFAAQFDIEVVFPKFWTPFLAELEAIQQPIPLNRAERRRQKRAKVPA